MRVCVLQTSLDPYKGGNHLPLLAACTGVRFTIVCSRSKVRAEDLPPNVQVVTIPSRTGPYYFGCADFLFARAVLRRYPARHAFWKEFNAIHLNQVMGPALRKLRTCGVPLLFLIHHPVTADREVAVRESGLFAACVWRLKYSLLVRWQRAMCHVCHRVATVSAAMQKRIAADYRVPMQNIAVVENGVEGSDFPFVPYGDCTSDVIAIGSFVHPRKGFRYLERVYRGLAAKGYRITDVGRRSDAQLAALKTIPGVTFHQTVNQETLVRLLSRSRVLISTSLFEGFGLSLIEALACGRPAVAFAVGAVPEVLGGIDAGLVVPARDTDSMIRTAEAFLRQPTEECDARGAGYRERVLSRYPLSASADALQSLYSSMAS